PAGVSIDSTNHLIRITANNVTLNGFDFSLHGGWGVYIGSGITGTVIENCNFTVGSNLQSPISALAGSGDLTVENCTMNGGAANTPLGDIISYNGSGNFVADYNEFYNVWQHGIDFGSGPVTPTVNYNLFYDM